MTLDAERLNKAKQNVAGLAAAIETGDATRVSQEDHRLLNEVAELDDAAWGPLLAGLEDDELRDQLDSLRRRIADVQRIVEASGGIPDPLSQVGHVASFSISNGSLMIDLNLGTGGQSLHSRQDLEDTLWIGAAIVEAVSEVMRRMAGLLSIKAQGDCIGAVFEDNLKRAEDAVGEIRRLHTEMREADAPDDGG